MLRYAVYFAPRPGVFADRAAAWLGWDAAAGHVVAQPAMAGLPRVPGLITGGAARYGFHGTIRAPFGLTRDGDEAAVFGCVADLAARLAPVSCDGLVLQNLHGFLALTPVGHGNALHDLAAAVVTGTDHLRAPLTEAEIARRKPESLSARQRALLDRWGYPYVMEEFRFHLTLTDPLPANEVVRTAAVLAAHFGPVLPRPFVIDDLCVFGEDDTGRFHLLHRYALTG